MHALAALADAPVGYARQNPERMSMIETLHHPLSIALSRAARWLDAGRRRFLAFGPDAVGAAIALPVVATPALVAVRVPVTTRPMRDHFRAARAVARRADLI